MKNSMWDDTAVTPTIVPALRTAAAAVNGTTVDLVGLHENNFRSSMMVAYAGAVADGTHTVKLQESDDNVTFTDATQVDGGPVVFALASQNTSQRLSYNGSKRYLRGVVTTAAATVGGTVGALIITADGSGRPVV